MMLARALVFLAGFCLMTIELLAGRIMAPYLGVSLYTWTSVIGAVLVGVTFGNTLGGWLADRYHSARVLGLCFAFAGLLTVFVNTLARAFGPRLAASGWPLSSSTAVFACFVFFPAAFCLSTITPQVIKRTLHSLDQTGMTIGNLGAWSALGSITGTFVTGFIFIAFFGTNMVLDIMAILLFATAILVAWRERIWRHRMALFIAMFLVGDLLMPRMCAQETATTCTRLIAGKPESLVVTTTIAAIVPFP